MARNAPVYNHPLMGTQHIYRPFATPYDPDLPENKPGHPEYGPLVIGNGMAVGIKQVFRNWNEVRGLDMLYVYCFATGQHTHVTPFDLGLTRLHYEVSHEFGTARSLVCTGGEPFGDALLVERHDGTYYMGDLDAGKALITEAYPEGSITEHPANEHGTVLVVEHAHSEDTSLDGANQWGKGYGSEEAWRYLMGSDFGPIDGEYDEAYLRGLITERMVTGE